MEIPKYPRTPHWPYSQTIPHGERLMTDLSKVVGNEVVITEKLDGSNILLHQGDVYARSVSGGPAQAQPWLAMVRKHHAWKTNSPEYQELFLYGEDIYGVHSIEYGPVPEEGTFHAFASIQEPGIFDSFQETRRIARSAPGIPTVPIIHQGIFETSDQLDQFLREYMNHGQSALGGDVEGMVIRYAGAFPATHFNRHVCKYVRPDHIQTDEHWTRHWRPCQLTLGNRDQTKPT